MSTTTQFDYGQSFGLTATVIPATKNLQTEEYHFSFDRHAPEEIRQMHPDWETRAPVLFEEMFGCLELSPDEAESYMQTVAESREESRRFAIEQAERGWHDQ